MSYLEEIQTKMAELQALVKKHSCDVTFDIEVKMRDPQPFVSPHTRGPIIAKVDGDLVRFGSSGDTNAVAIFKDGELLALIKWLSEVQVHMEHKYGRQNKT